MWVSFGLKEVVGSNGRTKRRKRKRKERSDQPKKRKVVVGWLVGGCLWVGVNEKKEEEKKRGVNKNEKR